MKETETRREFIRLRADGKSYSAIAKELGISKSTCTAWAGEYAAEIDEAKRIQWEELITSYRMTAAARIRELGETLNAIDAAIAAKDLSELPADKLLNLKLRYMEALKEECMQPPETFDFEDTTGLIVQYDELYKGVWAGQISPSQAKAQLSILTAKDKALAVQENEMLFGSFAKRLMEQ